MNTIVLIGHIGQDAELRYTTSGVAVANFALGVSGRKGADGERSTDWFDVTVWAKQAESISQWLTKGRHVAVQGEMHSRKYQAKDGSQRTAWSVNATHVDFLDKPKEGGRADADSEEVPF